MTRDQRVDEMHRLKRRLFGIVAVMVVVSIAETLIPDEKLFPFALWLVRHVGLKVGEALILVISLIGLQVVATIIMLIITFQTGKALVSNWAASNAALRVRTYSGTVAVHALIAEFATIGLDLEPEIPRSA
jgi:hypothetical protein